jgi:hypothetical protein
MPLRGWINRAIAISSRNLVYVAFIPPLDQLAQECKFQHLFIVHHSFIVPIHRSSFVHSPYSSFIVPFHSSSFVHSPYSSFIVPIHCSSFVHSPYSSFIVRSQALFIVQRSFIRIIHHYYSSLLFTISIHHRYYSSYYLPMVCVVTISSSLFIDTIYCYYSSIISSPQISTTHTSCCPARLRPARPIF